MKNYLTLLFTFFILTIIAQTNSVKTSPMLAEAEASSVGMSKERLAWIDTMCIEALDQSRVPRARCIGCQKWEDCLSQSIWYG